MSPNDKAAAVDDLRAPSPVSTDYATTHRDATLKLAREVAGIKADDPRPEFVYDDGMRSHAIDPDFTIPVDKLKWMNEQLVKDGNLKQPVDLSKFIDPSIREKALALVGTK